MSHRSGLRPARSSAASAAIAILARISHSAAEPQPKGALPRAFSGQRACLLKSVTLTHLESYAWRNSSRPANILTVSSTVAHSSFQMERENSHKQVVKSGTCTKSRDGGTGRRSGLKIRRYLVPWGFDSPSRHQPKSAQNERLAGLAHRMRRILRQTQRTSRPI